MVNKKRKRLFIITLVACILVEIIFIMGIFYTSQKFRAFNRVIDKLFFNAVEKFSKPAEPEETDVLPVEFNADAINGISPIFEEATTEIAMDEFIQVFTDYDFLIEMNADGTGFSLSGDLRRLAKDFIAEEEEVNSWSFAHSVRILSKPSFFEDCIAFIDANLEMVLVDTKTGEQKDSFYCGILPAGPAKAMGNSYYFMGKNGEKYRALFSVLPESQQALIDSSNFFIPDIVAQSNIFFKLESWQKIDSQSLGNRGASISPIFDKIAPMPEESPVPLEGIDKAPMIFIISPSETGIFELKICTETGEILKMPSYVALFDAVRGQLIGSSLDNLSDNPVIETELQSDSLYYLAVGSLEPLAADQNIFVKMGK